MYTVYTVVCLLVDSLVHSFVGVLVALFVGVLGIHAVFSYLVLLLLLVQR